MSTTCPLCGAGYAPFGAETCEQVDWQVHLTRAAPTPPSRPGGGSFTPTPTTTPDSGNAAQADNPRAGPAPIPEPCATGASSTVAELHVVRALAASRPPRLARRPAWWTVRTVGAVFVFGQATFAFATEDEVGRRLAAVQLLRPARKGEPDRPGARLFKPLRQVIESINDTFKGQLDLEHHGGRTPPGSSSGSCNASLP